MREINNNVPVGLNNTNYSKVEPKKELPKGEQPQEAQTAVTTSETLSKAPEAIIGRSQVDGAKKSLQLSEVEKDVNTVLQNPEYVNDYNKFFELSYNSLSKKGDPEAYEKSSVIADAYCKEVHPQ